MVKYGDSFVKLGNVSFMLQNTDPDHPGNKIESAFDSSCR